MNAELMNMAKAVVNEDKHTKRNAAIAGGIGVAGLVGAERYSSPHSGYLAGDFGKKSWEARKRRVMRGDEFDLRGSSFGAWLDSPNYEPTTLEHKYGKYTYPSDARHAVANSKIGRLNRHISETKFGGKARTIGEKLGFVRHKLPSELSEMVSNLGLVEPAVSAPSPLRSKSSKLIRSAAKLITRGKL